MWREIESGKKLIKIFMIIFKVQCEIEFDPAERERENREAKWNRSRNGNEMMKDLVRAFFSVDSHESLLIDDEDTKRRERGSYGNLKFIVMKNFY